MSSFFRARSVSSAAVVISLSAGLASAQEPVQPTPVPSPSAPVQPVAQQPAAPYTVTGQVRRAGTLAPVAKATVIVEGAGIQVLTDPDGRFVLDNVPPASRHVIIAAPGLMPLRAELTLNSSGAVPLDAVLDVEVHYTEVVSVSPEARDLFASYQPTSVLAGQELNRELQGSLGATLQAQPGVAERSFGPGPSRPVIRGMDGDRVLILENGQRVGDLSSQSGDHGVPVNPASAARIEVVRGPATLLYGANAIGGLVNVIDETIPTKPVEGVHGNVVLDGGTAADEADAATALAFGNGRWAGHVGASGRRSGDVATPAGKVENTQSRGGFGNVGVSFTGAKGYVGGSYGYDDTRYGIPFVEEGQVELTPRRHVLAMKGEVAGLGGIVEGVRADLAVRRYQHDEVVAGETGTHFENDTNELNLLVRQRAAGRLTGTVGGWLLERQFVAEGAEALSPNVRERGAAAFFYEEVAWPHVTFQFGARVNHASFQPESELPSRTFTDASGSVGLLIRPEAAGDKLTIALNLAHASRNPALEELYFFGPHPGNFAFEVGNADLRSERALGLDASLRWRAARSSGELTLFRNHISNYIFRNPISAEEFVDRYGEVGEDEGEFPFTEFVGADSLLQGFEAHTDLRLAGGFGMELGLDYVRGTLRDSGEPLPRMPPLRTRVGVNYQRDALQLGAQVVGVSKQERVFGDETPTEGYGLLKLFASYSFTSGAATSTITARLDNATNQLYRNHLSLIKDYVPEMGRNFKLIYAVTF